MYDNPPAYEFLVAIDTRRRFLAKLLQDHQNHASCQEGESKRQTHHNPHNTIRTKVYVRVTGQHDPRITVWEEPILLYREAAPVPAISTHDLTLVIAIPGPSPTLPIAQRLNTRRAHAMGIKIEMRDRAARTHEKTLVERRVRAKAGEPQSASADRGAGAPCTPRCGDRRVFGSGGGGGEGAQRGATCDEKDAGAFFGGDPFFVVRICPLGRVVERDARYHPRRVFVKQRGRGEGGRGTKMRWWRTIPW